MSSIILPEKAVQVLLTNKIMAFNKSIPTYIHEIFMSQLYGQTNITDWANYFDSHNPKVKLGWPNPDTESPAIYVAAAEANHEENLIGDISQQQISSDMFTTEEAFVYAKAAKVIAATDNYNISLILAGICEYFIHQEGLWFETFGMTLPRINYQEVDFVSQLWPQRLFYRTFLVTFMVVDTIIVSKNDTIKGINVDII